MRDASGSYIMLAKLNKYLFHSSSSNLPHNVASILCQVYAKPVCCINTLQSIKKFGSAPTFLPAKGNKVGKQAKITLGILYL